MNKRLMALLLVLCMVLCAGCNKGGGEATDPVGESKPDVQQEKPDFSKINETEPNEQGIYQIHSVKGLQNMAAHPEGKFELLQDVDMEGATWTPVGTKAAPFTGSFAGKGFYIRNLTVAAGADGYTGFFGVNSGNVVSLKLENVQMDVQTGFAGGIAGENKGTIDMCAVTGDMTVGGDAVVGSLVGKQESGVLSFSEGGMAIRAGDSATVGLLGGQLKNITVQNCNFVGAMNTKGGTLFTNMAGTEEAVTYQKCLWRDNTNSTEFLPEEARQMRDTAESRMRAMGSIQWTVSENMSFLYPTSTNHNQYFQVGQTYVGVPYTGKCSSLERFLYCFNEDGTLKDFATQKVVGYDNFDMYMGVDCSGGVYWAWAGISPTSVFQWTNNMFPVSGNGTVPVGDFEGAYTLTDSKQMVDLNGVEKMAECFAQLHKGDAITTYFNDPTNGNHANHTRLMAVDPVILRDENGKIDLMSSYCLYHGQGDGISLGKENTTWVIDGKAPLEVLISDYYVPLTNAELKAGKLPECTVTIDNDQTGKAYMTTGTVQTNYRLVSVTIRVTDEKGKDVWEKTLFTPVDKYDTARTDYAARKSARSFNLAAFAAYIGEMELEKGKTYTYELSAMPANSQNYVLKTFTFEH